VNNFFVTFIEVLKDRKGESISVDEVGNSTGDYLHGFYLGTREALDEKDRETLTVTIKEVNANSIGQLIALFERAVGLYAHLININAYHQPGVEAGKKAATNILKMKQTVCELLEKESPSPLSVDAIAEKTSLQTNEELIFKILYRLAHNSASNIQLTSNTCPTEAEFYSQ
jgi:glucose-6-phosphate isomerase